MGRMHSHRKGKSHSRRPASKRSPSWTTYSPDEIVTLIVKMVKEGLTASQIGVRLRDEYGIPLVKPILGKSISEIIAENKLTPDTPPDVGRLLQRAKKLQEHLKIHSGDRKNVRSLELLEAKIHRLSKYYKRMGRLPAKWKYATVIAQLE
ncbi:MAG: 30S ribosomal protein S15 [Thaumarchaeota archaeon]|nr:30S ribosomal protein S15 [Nitrososphaerota archaeon]